MDAYVDDEARELVRLARVRLNTFDRRIIAYSTTARERASVSLQAGIAGKLIYRRETVTRINWHQDRPIEMEILALREAAPLFDAAAQVPDDIASELPRLAFDPADPGMLMRIDTTSLRHPLAEGGERHYRFASGDTTVIRLPDGRVVRLRELRVIPRSRQPQYINGSFWLDAETHAVVQAYFRLARAFDADAPNTSLRVGVSTASPTDSGETRTRGLDLASIGALKPIRADIDYIALEYGLWDLQWWLPRLVTASGYVQVSRFRAPIAYERTYEDYTVEGDPGGMFVQAPDSLPRRCRAVLRYVSTPGNEARDSVRQAEADSVRARRKRAIERSRAAGDTLATPDCEREVVITAAADSILLNSPELPSSIYAGDHELISEDELNALEQRVRAIAAPPWALVRPRFQLGTRGPGLVRYNRVEALSVGARMQFDAGNALLGAEARIGVADIEPRGELSLDRRDGAMSARFAAYRRLQPVTASSAHGTFASLGALIFGRDDGQYYDALGTELLLQPRPSSTQWFDLRMYAERQRAVSRNTDFSLVHLFDADRRFLDNFAADRAVQLGTRLRLRAASGTNPAAFRLATELSLGAETGDFTFVRPELLVRATAPLTARLSLSVEGAAGTTEGSDVPMQAHTWLGGAATLRGYPGGVVNGERYWRARAELARGAPGARLALFGDAGWAAPRNRFDARDALYAAGLGASFFDDVFRIDLAHGFSDPGGLRLHVHFSGFE